MSYIGGSTYRTVRLGLAPQVFVENGTTRLELPNGLIQKRLLLRLTGNLVVATATATIFSEAPLGLLKQIQLIGDGRRYLCSADGRQLFRLGHLMHRKKGELAPPLGTAGTRAFSATVILDAEALNFSDMSESMLDTRLFKKLELVIQWGAATDIATAGGGGTIALTNVSVDVQALETAEGVGQIMFDHILSPVSKPVVATSINMAYDDIPQSGLLAGILFRSTRDAGAGAGPVPVDDIINSITLKSDVSIRHVDKAKWRTLQSDNLQQFLIDGGDATTGQLVGYAYLDLSENGMFSSALNINGLNKAQLELDVTSGSGTQIVDGLYDFFEPRRAAQGSVQKAA